MKTTNLH